MVIATFAVIVVGNQKYKKTLRENQALAMSMNQEIISEEKDQKTEESQQHKYKDKRWLAIGDDISVDNEYQTKVKALCEIDSVETIASKGQQLGLLADSITQEKLAGADLITVFAGTNDYGNSKPLGTITDDKTMDTFYGNIKNVIDKIKTFSPDAKVVFFTPLKRGSYISGTQPVYPSKNTSGFTLENYATAIKEVCQQNSIQVIDLLNISGIELNNVADYTKDGLNLNADGYDKIAKVIAEELEK